MKNNRGRWLILCLCVTMLCVACNENEPMQPNVPDTPIADDKNENNTPDDLPEVPEEPVVEEPKTNETEEPNLSENTPPEKTQSEEERPFWQSESTRITNNLVSIAAAAQKDYNASAQTQSWISKNGRLYSGYDGTYVTLDKLVADGYLQTELSSGDYELLMVKGEDLAGYEGISLSAENNGMRAFATTKYGDRYLVASPTGKVGYLTEGDYVSLLSKYNQSHGRVARLSSLSEDYERIINYICLYEGTFSEFFVREIRKDDKYAIVVLSPKTNSAEIKQYVLRNENNFWEVVIPNLQTELYPKVVINQKYPDFNMEILPNYNLATWKNYIVSSQGGALAGMFSKQYVTSESQIYYQCGTASCYYFVLVDGSRYACYNKDGIWEVEPVKSDIEANSYFKTKTGKDYGFIILDEKL